MKIAELLVLTGAFVVLAAEPGGGVTPVSPGSPPLSAAAAGARRPVVSICPKGSSQDMACLSNAGAIGPDGAVNAKQARLLLRSGTCPCNRSGGTTTGTVPFDPGG